MVEHIERHRCRLLAEHDLHDLWADASRDGERRGRVAQLAWRDVEPVEPAAFTAGSDTR